MQWIYIHKRWKAKCRNSLLNYVCESWLITEKNLQVREMEFLKKWKELYGKQEATQLKSFSTYNRNIFATPSMT